MDSLFPVKEPPAESVYQRDVAGKLHNPVYFYPLPSPDTSRECTSSTPFPASSCTASRVHIHPAGELGLEKTQMRLLDKQAAG